MRWLTCLIIATAAVVLSGTSAIAELTAVATWNDGPGGWTGYGSYNDNAGFDWLITTGEVQAAGTCIPGELSDYPDADRVGKWGGGLRDDAGVDAACYVEVNELGGGSACLIDAQGTIEFWFKPDWDPDPVLETDKHAIYKSSTGYDCDGLRIAWEGDGTMVTQMITASPELQSIGHTWTSPALILDWNHVAFVWDENGIFTYCNGNKVGETIYSGPAPSRVSWGDWHMVMLGQDGNCSTDYQSDGTWDSLAIWDEVLYSGETYTMPTEEPRAPAQWAGDINEDGWVGQFDLDIVLAAFAYTGPWPDPGHCCCIPGDVNKDCFIGTSDLDYVLADWGQGTLPTAPVPEPATLGVFAFCGLALLRRKVKSR